MRTNLPRLMRDISVLLLGIACGPATDKPAPSTAAVSSGITLDSAQASRVSITPAVNATFHSTVHTTGVVMFNGDRSTAVISPISGPVSRVVASLGQRVRAGDVLATVASADYAAAIAEYHKSDAAWRNARRIAELNDKLLATGALPRAERDQSASDLLEATADRGAAIAALAALGLDDSAVAAIEAGQGGPEVAPAIHAPIAGTVVERLITPGQLLEAGATPAFTIADLSSMWVDANVFAGDIARVTVGDRAWIHSEAIGDSVGGTVTWVGAVVDPATRATAVRVLVPNAERRLRQNMLVQVVIRSASSRSGVVVPIGAVLRDNANLPYLFVAQGGGQFARRHIELGERLGDRYEIASGLSAGEQVVSDGGLYLSEVGAP